MKKYLNIMLNYALSHIQRGWPVFPMHGIKEGGCTCGNPHCKSPGKHPAIKDWRTLATTDAETVKHWFRRGSDFNIGAVTGQLSNLIVIDVDPRNGGSEAFASLPPLNAQTARSKTGGGGFHLFLEMQAEDINLQKNAFGDGIDVQGNGRCVVMPGSMHKSGHRYVWEHSPRAVGIKPIPSSWRDLAVSRRNQRSAATLHDSRNTPEGGRNSLLTSLAGKMHRDGMSEAAVRAALHAENADQCSPPLERDEVEKIIASVRRYGNSSSDDVQALADQTLERRYNNGEHLIYAIDGQFWSFHDTHWSPLSEVLLKKAVKMTLEELSPIKFAKGTVQLLNEVASLLKVQCARREDLLRFAGGPSSVINCKNGELWLDPLGKVALKPHQPSSFLRSCMDVNYDPSADCPTYSRVVGEIFSANKDQSAMVAFWHELMGYALQPRRPTAKILLLWGTGSNGKTKLVETLLRLIGPGNALSMPLSGLGESRFAKASLMGKYIYVDDDVKSGTRLPDDILKQISEEKFMTSDTKHGAHVQFRSHAMPVLLFNNPPQTDDVSWGLRRRLVVIAFGKQFDGKNPLLFDGIWKKEMSGILNLYLQGLERVIRAGWNFKPPTEIAAAGAELLRQANPVPEYIEARCAKRADYLVPVTVLYEDYKSWAAENGTKHILQRGKFVSNVLLQGFSKRRTSAAENIVGIRLKAAPALSEL